MKSLTGLAFVSVICGFVLRAFVTVTALGFATVPAASPAHAKTITIVGIPHLAGLNVEPSSEQISHSIAALSAFGPTQVCVERMSGDRIEAMLADPGVPEGRRATGWIWTLTISK